jgi:hypothetical protein
VKSDITIRNARVADLRKYYPIAHATDAGCGERNA